MLFEDMWLGKETVDSEKVQRWKCTTKRLSRKANDVKKNKKNKDSMAEQGMKMFRGAVSTVTVGTKRVDSIDWP